MSDAPTCPYCLSNSDVDIRGAADYWCGKCKTWFNDNPDDWEKADLSTSPARRAHRATRRNQLNTPAKRVRMKG